MKNSAFFILTLFFVTGCKQLNEKTADEPKRPQIEEPQEVEAEQGMVDEAIPEFEIDDHLIQYDNLKKKIAIKRSEIAGRADVNNEEKQLLAERYISAILIDSIFEYWEGTRWDFNGYTETPRKGVVACGYYVSTTLRDLGLNINRYKVAQKSATDIIKSLCDVNSIKTLNGFNTTREHLQDLFNNEIVVVGLDFHVGFVYKQNDVLYFTHSNYIDLEGVMKELLDDSLAFKNSENYVVGKLTKNTSFLVKWLNND